MALVSVAASTLLTFALRPVLGAQTHYLTFTLAAIVTAWFGSWGPGLLATAVGFLATDYFFIEPLYQISPLQTEDAALLVAIGVTVSFLTGRVSSATKHLSIATRAAGVGTFEWIAANDRLKWTPELARLYGLKPAEFKSASQILIDRIYAEDVARVKGEVREAVVNQQPEIVQEFRIVLPDGTLRWIEARSRLLYDKTGKLVQTIGANIDVTERHARELERETLIEREKAARSAANAASAAFAGSNEDLQGFAYAVSHDLRQPLRTIGVYTELLIQRAGPALDAESRHIAGIIVKTVDQMRNLVEGLLTFCRVGYGASDAEKPVDANAVVVSAIQHLKAAIEESAARITVDRLPRVAMDEQQLLHVFLNLLGNAIKFRGSRIPAIHVAAERQGNAWRFSISDNGIGIDVRYRDQIFEVFKRLHTSSDYEGAGIGLTLVRRVIERSGGQIWFDSELQKGSTFYFTIPSGARTP